MTCVAQPSGEVTLVFSDIEGSTRLLETLGTEAYREALSEHRRIVREAYAKYSGYEVDYEGDAFFYTFSSVQDAVSAVSDAMAGLEPGPISIRVGIHTGAPELDPPKYVGMDVHTAARIMSCGHGGQVVVSPTSAALLDTPLIELGEHRLKDIAEAVPLFQLGEGSFPPLKSISNTNLPRPASSFLGREAELEQVVSRIEQGARLLTLTGPGGTGKTRLALEAASSFVGENKAGVFWVGLATLRDPALVTETIAQTLGAKDDLAFHIAERELLLLLDNLEQVIEAAPELSALLSVCPNLTLLVTSRELLRVSGEVEYAVPPLAEPDAVSLFCERSQLAPSAEIAELCDRLDSLPLAVELAAARTKVLSPAQILERLAQRLDLLKGGRDADPRQQTLRGTIEWSYELLAPEERQLFARLSVFSGGCTLEAAEEVAEADLDTLQSLVEKSLLRFTTTEGGSRYWMLETIREYAAERLDNAGEILPIRQRHADRYLSLAERVERERSEAASTEPLQRLADEHDNVRLALSWFVEREESDCALRLVCALADYWVVRGGLAEARAHADDVLAMRAEQSPRLRARALAIASDLARDQGDLEGARRCCEESLALSRELGDLQGVGRALHELGEAALAEEDFDRAVELFYEAVDAARAAGHNGAGSIGNIGYVALLRRDYDQARQLSAEATQLFRERGHQSGIAVGLAIEADAAVFQGRSVEARLLVGECLVLGGELGFREVIASGLETSAALLADGDQAELAARLAGAANALREDIDLLQTPSERSLHQRMHATLRETLGASAVEDLYDEGRELDVEQSIALARAALD